MEWINRKNQEPDPSKYEDILIWWIPGKCIVLVWYDEALGWNYTCSDETFENMEFDYWMPLPDRPERLSESDSKE